MAKHWAFSRREIMRKTAPMPLAQSWRDDDVCQHQADYFTAAVIEDTLGRRVEVHDPSLMVHGNDRVEGGIDDSANAFPAFMKGVFIAPPLDVLGLQIFCRLHE